MPDSNRTALRLACRKNVMPQGYWRDTQLPQGDSSYARNSPVLSQTTQRSFRNGPELLPLFILAAVVFGIVCRVSQYAANTSVWHDEAYVALNVFKKTFAGLLGPLDWNEPAPPASSFWRSS